MRSINFLYYMRDFKSEAKKQWSRAPVGTGYTQEELGSPRFFEAVERHRYSVYAPWLLPLCAFSRWKGKRVLEVGVGSGTDHVQIAKAGALMSGVDITPLSIELTKNNLARFGLSSDLQVADAESLPFEDDSFDAVYSFGVLHHTPNIEKAIGEIRRVLRPGGEALVAMYHKHSAFLFSIILYDMVLKGGFFKQSLQDRLSDIEFGGEGARPLVRTLSRREALSMFKDFNKTEICVRHFATRFSGKRVDAFLRLRPMHIFCNWMAKRIGWYLVVRAMK